MAHVPVIAKLTAAEGKGDELAAVIEDLVKAVSQEAGTVIYTANRDTDDPSVFWFFELYDGPDSAAAHASGTALAEAGSRMRGLLGGRPEVHRLSPVAATGLPG